MRYLHFLLCAHIIIGKIGELLEDGGNFCKRGGGFKHIAAVIVGFVAVSIVGFGRGLVYWTLSWVVKKP